MSSRGRGRRTPLANTTPERAEMRQILILKRTVKALHGHEPAKSDLKFRAAFVKLASDEEQQLKLDEGIESEHNQKIVSLVANEFEKEQFAIIKGEEEVSLWKNVKPSMKSEEESDPEEKTTLRRRRPLWRSEAFNGLIQDVDSRCCDTEISSKRQKKKRVDGEPLPNSAPSNAEPWMYISPINLLKASLVYAFRFEPLNGRELKHDGTNKTISHAELVLGDRCLKDYGLRLSQAADSAKVSYAMALLPAFCFSAAFQFELVSQILKHDSTNKSITRGKNKEEHLTTVEEVLKRLQNEGLRVNKEKCCFLTTSVQYLGHRIDANGIHATGEKLDAILMAPVPSSVPQLRSFLGMINYYSKFIPNLATLLNPLNELLRKDVQWKWTDQREQAFKQAKQCLTSPNVLVHYDPTLPIKLAGDASAERNYAQLEKEALSLIFGVKKFHEYLYGRRFTLLTDHKPLTTILGPKTGVPPLAAARLQRWALLLSAYEYDLEFRPTAQHANADGLSRLPLSIIADAGTATSDSDVFNVGQIEALPVTAMQLRKVTRQDPILSKVVTFTRNGWPSIVPENLKPYWTCRNELTVEGDCL
eukprot:Em0058g2a